MSTIDRSHPPSPAPVKPFVFPRIERRKLANGLPVLTARHGRIPIVTVELVIEAGATTDPSGKEGLAHLTAHALDIGTRTRSAAQIAWDLEYLGVELEVDTSWDAAAVRVTVPRERLEPALELFSDLVRNPAFPEDEVQRIRGEQLAGLLQRAKDPRILANDMAARVIHAPSVPYARPVVGTKESVAALTREDVEAFHRARYHVGGTALLMVGDIDAADAESLAAHYFADWTAAPSRRAAVNVLPAVQSTTVFVVNRPGSVQSEIRIGHVGVERHHPDYFPIEVMNAILGGVFTSRLNMNLRERNGFTYGARSAFAFRRSPGPFVVSAAVATDVTAAAVREALAEIDALRVGGATVEEVSLARDYLTGILPLELQTTDQLAGRLADLVIYDLPDDYFQQYRERVAAVTAAEVQRVAAEHIHPERFAVLVVGDGGAVVPMLTELSIGPVEVREVP